MASKKRGRLPAELTGIPEAAEYLYSILDEFKPADTTATEAAREARTLLDIAVRRLFDAFTQNVVVKKLRGRS